MGQTKSTTDNPAVSEDPLYFVRVRGGADVEILRRATEQQIAHTAPYQIGDVVELAQAVEDLERVGVDLAA